MRSRFSSVAAASTAAVLTLSGVAFADNIVADGDLASANQTNLSFGTICANSTARGTAQIAVKRNGNDGTTNVFASSSIVTVQVVSASTGLSARMIDSPAQITIPKDWDLARNNTLSDAVASNVTLAAGDTVGSFSGTVTYQAIGQNAAGGSVTRNDTMTVSATISKTGSCAPAPTDTTLPSVTVDMPTPPDGQNGWFNANDASTIEGTVTASDASNITAITCDGATLGTIHGYGTATASAPLTVSGDGTHDISCTATDGASPANSGAAVGSDATATILIDRTAPSVTCGSDSGAWHNANVSVACVASDGPSGLAIPADQSFSLSTSVPADTETDNASTGSHTVYDLAGNSTYVGQITGIKVDLKAPMLDYCDKPAASWSNADVTLYCHYTDGGSGPTTDTVALSTHVPSGTENSNAPASANGAQACDNVGNCADSPGDIPGSKIDKAAPTLTGCDQPDGNWHNDNVTLNCAYADGGSGLTTDKVTLSTDVPTGNENSNAPASANGAQACDNVGNCADSPGDILGNKIDRKAPAVSIDSPNGAYVYGQNVAAAFSCSDGGSEVKSCEGDVPNGSAIDTTAVGSHTFTVIGTDNVDNIGTQQSNYTVSFSKSCTDGVGGAVLQPVNSDGSSTFKRGSTVPVKFRICDANGKSIGSSTSLYDSSQGGVFDNAKGAVPVLVSRSADSGSVDEAVTSTTPDTVFRWDPTARQWIFNQSTKNLVSGTKYSYTIWLAGGQHIDYSFGVK